jgi:hypothetical protein
MVDCIYPTQTAASHSPASATTRSKSKPVTPVDFVHCSPADLDMGHGVTPPHTIKLSPPVLEGGMYNMSYQTSPTASSPDYGDDPDGPDLDLPESRERRLWELRLLHNSIMEAKPFSTAQSPSIHNLFSLEVPSMAIKEGRDSILYGMMAHSALNLWTRSSDPHEKETLIRLQQTYLSMMLRQQRRDIANLNPSNADAICFSSLKILTHSLALIQTLPVEPWEPPLDWLQMGRGADAVFHNAAAFLRDRQQSSSRIKTFLQSPPVLNDPAETIHSDHSALDWILEAPPASAHYDTELDDDHTRSVYEKAIAYTCSVQRALDRQEPEFAICRRLGAFSVWVPTEFTQFLIERRPRAMVVLAHFMSLFLDIEHVWIIGKAGENQIRGIYKNLPMEWCYKLDGLFQKFKKPEDSPKAFSGGFGALM